MDLGNRLKGGQHVKKEWSKNKMTKKNDWLFHMIFLGLVHVIKESRLGAESV